VAGNRALGGKALSAPSSTISFVFAEKTQIRRDRHLFSNLKIIPLRLVRNRHWLVSRQSAGCARFSRRPHAILVLVDAPTGNHFTILRSELNAIAHSHLTYLRLHGRIAQAYLKGNSRGTLRLRLQRRRDRGSGRTNQELPFQLARSCRFQQ